MTHQIHPSRIHAILDSPLFIHSSDITWYFSICPSPLSTSSSYSSTSQVHTNYLINFFLIFSFVVLILSVCSRAPLLGFHSSRFPPLVFSKSFFTHWLAKCLHPDFSCLPSCRRCLPNSCLGSVFFRFVNVAASNKSFRLKVICSFVVPSTPIHCHC